MTRLVVISADLKEPIRKGAVYIEINLPRGVQVLTQTVESTKLQWNRTFELWVISTHMLVITELDLSFQYIHPYFFDQFQTEEAGLPSI